ncbi:MAG: hypothetical protein JXB05_32485 [Myxococcaceae bacterium]|nr:hypothetical protein [Myxococcaceae bacterium]
MSSMSSGSASLPPSLVMLAEAFGSAMGRALAQALHTNGYVPPNGNAAAPMRRRGRPPKMVSGAPVPTDRRCTVTGCERESRSKGLCSAHYQAARRRQLANGKSA